ncbi:MAG: hypothetical protein HFE77_00355 [Clostridiales bacterium]|nr:hypothetical protein [Clostridiales bacterium]
MKKLLSIEYKHLVDVTECWTLEKLSIIQASPFSEDWLASHLNIIMHSDYSVSFGDSYYKYSPAYFDDILHAKVIDYFQNQNVLDIIIDNINQGRYVKFFRWLIYGYNIDEKIVYVLFEKTTPEENIITFDEVETRFRGFIKEFGKEDLSNRDINARLYVAKHFQYPFVTYAIRKDYSVDNCPYSALTKIDREIWGNRLQITGWDDTNPEKVTMVYDGIACLQGLKKQVFAYTMGDTANVSRLAQTIKKLHEHRCLLLLSLNYIRKKWKIELDSCDECIKTYSACCNIVERWCLLALKYEAISEPRLLQKIHDAIDKQLEQEKHALLEFRKIAYGWYNEQNLI